MLLLDVGKLLITLLDLLKEIASHCFRFLSLLSFYLSSLLKKVDERRKSMSKVWRNGKVVTELVVPCSSCETVSNKSNDCRKTTIKLYVLTGTNQIRNKQRDEPIRIPTNHP